MAESGEHEKVDREACPHLAALREPVGTDGPGKCAVCGGEEHLRVCQTCGAVHCCESLGAHDRDHWDEEDHPLIRPHHRESYDFLWCYGCGAYLT